MKLGLPVCVAPCTSVDTAGVPVGVTGVTVGVYIAFTTVPFLSWRCTTIPAAVPTNDFSGTKVTVPSGATVYVPSPGTTLVVEPSTNVAGTSLSIGTAGFPSVKVGLPV